MISTKETLWVRLEVDFEILAGELRTLEEDTGRMDLSKLVNVWSPETRGARLMLRLTDIKEANSESGDKGKVD